MDRKFYDLRYHSFSSLSDITVVCPKCEKAGVVHLDRERGVARFQCNSCYAEKEVPPGGRYAFEVTGQCTSTGRFFRSAVPETKVHGPKVRIPCRFCEETVVGDVMDNRSRQPLLLERIKNAEDPYFHYPLYFQTSFRGRTIWAMNREHLQYLIDYLSADLRTVEPDFHEKYRTMRSQSDMLPAFMKTAKNRAGIVKALTKLQKK